MELLQTITGKVTEADNRSHLRHLVRLNQDYESIEVRFDFTPTERDSKHLTAVQAGYVYDESSLLALSNTCELKDVDVSSQEEAVSRRQFPLALRNVLMISLEDKNGIRGMAHMLHIPLVHVLSGIPGKTSRGFSPGMIPEGLLRITVSVFSVFGQGCDYSLTIAGVPSAKAWRPFELHSHTLHSDGRFTVNELLSQARKLGYGGLALTDHNTVAGLPEFMPAAAKRGLVPLDGLELTTFHGHILMLGIREFVDWREFTKDNLEEKLCALRRRNPQMLIGIAHPYIQGSIACSGCRFSYGIKDWALIDYIEVSSSCHTGDHSTNDQAFALWTGLLKEGRRIMAVAGGDWHGPLRQGTRLSATYLLGPKKKSGNTGAWEKAPAWNNSFMESLRQGRAVISCGPVAELQVKEADGQKVWQVGDTVPVNTGKIRAVIRLYTGKISGVRQSAAAGDLIILESGKGILWQGPWKKATVAAIPLDRTGILSGGSSGWLRIRLMSAEGRLEAYTNAIYFAGQEGTETQ